MITYEALRDTFRKHSDTKTLPEGWKRFGTLDNFSDCYPLPHQVLREAMACPISDGSDPTYALQDLYGAGMNEVLRMEYYSRVNEIDPTLMAGYEVEFLAAFSERGSFKYLGDETPDAPETLIDELEDKATQVWKVGYEGNYFLQAHGLNSLSVDLLAEYPDRIKVYHVKVHEGEGWWGTMTFALRVPTPEESKAAEELHDDLRQAEREGAHF